MCTCRCRYAALLDERTIGRCQRGLGHGHLLPSAKDERHGVLTTRKCPTLGASLQKAPDEKGGEGGSSARLSRICAPWIAASVVGGASCCRASSFNLFNRSDSASARLLSRPAGKAPSRSMSAFMKRQGEIGSRAVSYCKMRSWVRRKAHHVTASQDIAPAFDEIGAHFC